MLNGTVQLFFLSFLISYVTEMSKITFRFYKDKSTFDGMSTLYVLSCRKKNYNNMRGYVLSHKTYVELKVQFYAIV